MSTRTATEGTPFRQERFASSSTYEPGLLGNLVAKRCKAIRSPDDRALVYWLHAQSHMEGGLQAFCEAFIAAFPNRIGSPAMRRIGKQVGQSYTETERRELRAEGLDDPEDVGFDAFLLFSEAVNDNPRHHIKPDPDSDSELWIDDRDGRALTNADAQIIFAEHDDYIAEQNRLHPPLTVESAVAECHSAGRQLPDHVRNICLDPRIDVATGISVWWFDDLLSALHEHRRKAVENARDSIAETTISKQIFEDLDYAYYTKGLVLIEGGPRTGKSKSTEAWVAAHPGQAIYVRLESGKDDLSFYRTISRAIGTASSGQMKGQEMRMRIEDMLQEKHLMVVIDEAHFLFPIIARPKSAPDRVDWLRTALVDHGVAVACVSTPQFDRQCAHFEKGIGWNAKQIKGRVKLQRLLPSELPVEDLAAVARKMVPAASAAQLEGLVGFAQGSDDYLAGIERLVCRATFFANRDGQQTFTNAHLQRALQEAMLTLQAADPVPTSPQKRPSRKARAMPLKAVCNRISDTPPRPGSRRASLDLSASNEAECGASERLQFTEAAASE